MELELMELELMELELMELEREVIGEKLYITRSREKEREL